MTFSETWTLVGVIVTAIGAVFTAASVGIAVHFYRDSLQRQAQALSRRSEAYKSLLARECELNLWTIKRLSETFNEISSGIDGAKFDVAEQPEMPPRFEMTDKEGDTSSWSIPKIHVKHMSEAVLDLATDHKELFALVQAALDALADLDHARAQLLSAPTQTIMDGASFLDGLADYGQRECADAREALDPLYLYCTGNALTKHRLR